MTGPRSCPQCQAELPADTPENVCPRCGPQREANAVQLPEPPGSRAGEGKPPRQSLTPIKAPGREIVPRLRLWCAAAAVAAAGLVGLWAWRHPASPAPPADTLRWGGDPGGGAPYVIPRGQDEQPAGFEGELAEYLADKLGLRGHFVRKDWEMLPQDLKRRDIDLILNGYEWFPKREQEMASTVPYYAYTLRLVVRRDSPIRGWDDLRRQPGTGKKVVGVLKNSAAYHYVNKQFGDDVQVLALTDDGTTGVLSKVVDRACDATVQDDPVIAWYLDTRNEFPELHAVGEPIPPFPHSYYVIFVRKTDTGLRDRLNRALGQALADGTLRRIYDSYGLDGKDQVRRLARAARNWPPSDAGADPATRQNTARELLGHAWTLTRAAGTTVALACLSMPLAMLAGLLIAVGRLHGPRWLAALLAGYVELVRGTPLLLQLTVIFYLLPGLGIYLHPFWAGLLGLAINYSAYEAENYRAGLLAIPRGQMEAALALGMSPWTALRRVIVPQAVRIVIPPVTNDFIALFKDTSVCAVIAVTELTSRYRELMVSDPRLVIELGLMTAVLYLLMSYPLSLLARRLEQRFPRVIV